MRYRILGHTLAAAAALALLSPQPALAQRLGGGDKSMPWLGLRLGGVAASSTPVGGTPTGAGGGGWVMFDGRDFLADAMIDLYGGTNAQLFAGGLGVYYPFIPQNVSPYAGGGLKLGWTKFGGDGAFGLLPYLAVGCLFGREGYVQVRAELSWWLAAAGEQRSDRPGETWHSNGLLLTLGLAF